MRSLLRPAVKSLWGYGAVVRAPDGTVVTLASSSKKHTAAPDGTIEELVLQLGVDDVAASRRFYAERGLTVARSFGRKYVTFETDPITLALDEEPLPQLRANGHGRCNSSDRGVAATV